MRLSEYQKRAKKTDQFSDEPDKIIHPLLNLTEAVGSLNRLIEQSRRDKKLPTAYAQERVRQKLGDLLWYLANIADRQGLSLEEVAQENLKRTEDRWSRANQLRGKPFDDSQPVYERLPRRFSIAFFEPYPIRKPEKIIIAIPTEHSEWIQVGDRIDDNAKEEDGYRYHDVLHLGHVAFLGWSPVIRTLLRRKRKSDVTVDRVDDGARATNTEEALTAFIFAHARRLEFFKSWNHVEFGLLKTIERLTRGLEVQHRSYDDWEKAILHGYAVFRKLRKRREGVVTVDLGATSDKKRLVVGRLPRAVKMILSGVGRGGSNRRRRTRTKG